MSKQSRTPAEELEYLRRINSDYASRIARLEFKLSMTEGELARLGAELAAQKRLKRQLKDVYHAIDARILTTIDTRGYLRKTRASQAVPFTVEAHAQDDVHALHRDLEAYDTKLFFRLHSPKTAMKIQYRIASKLYRTTRDTAMTAAKRAYQVKKRRHHE